MAWRKSLLIIAGIPLLGACAKSAQDIPSQYISPLQYSGYTCKQLQMEMGSLSAKVAEIGGQVNKQAEGDKVATGVGIILFWPALFFLDGDTPQATEYARLKGEFDALEKAAIQKECNFKIERPKVPEPVKRQEDNQSFGSPRQSSIQEIPNKQQQP